MPNDWKVLLRSWKYVGRSSGSWVYVGASCESLFNEEIQEGSCEPSFCVGFSPEFIADFDRRCMAEAGAEDFGLFNKEEAT